MLSIQFRCTVVRRSEQLKPLAGFLRNLKTETVSLEVTDRSEQDVVRSFEEIPGPKRSMASMFEMYRKSSGFTKSYKVTEHYFNEYGPIFKQNNLGSLMVHICDPDDIEKVFRAEGKYPERFVINEWVEHRKRRNYFPGILMLQGEEWHRVRRAVAPKMMRPKIVEENIDNFNAIAKVAVDRLFKLKETCGPQGEIPDLEGELKRWSTETVGILAFDARLGLYEDPPTEKAMTFIKAVHDFFELSQKLLFNVTHKMFFPYMDTPTFKKFVKVSDVILDIGQSFVDKKMLEMKEMAEKGIDNNSTEGQAVPLLTYLLVKNELSLQEINGMAIDVVFAGVDSTSNSVLWLLYNLARFPQIQEKLYQEVQIVLGRDGEVTSQNLPKLSYLKACLKESMRIFPVVQANSRSLDDDIVLSGYNVPAKTNIVTEFYVTARSDKYIADPLEFKPERWLRENKNELHAFASLPFGFGPRMCLGRRVAELEIYLLMCKILQRFRLEYHHEPVEPYQKLIAVPDRPVKIKFIDRL